jgi:hypothetical protein
MGNAVGMPRGAQIAIDDLLDRCAQIDAGQEVLILAHIDGLYGGDNLVDQEAISWIQSAVQHRGANPSVLWIDEPARPHAWRVPPVVKGAMRGCDVLINHSFDLVTEEMMELREVMFERGVIIVRNFATTAPLLCTAWAQTPYELVSEIRYQASVPFRAELPFQLIDENGTNLEGIVGPPDSRIFPDYTTRRHEVGGYRPWPEWVIPPINVKGARGLFVFDRMLSWWSRFIGIPPYFDEPVGLTIEDGRIRNIEGGPEADALTAFLKAMERRLGDGVYDFKQMHCGVHPQAMVEPHQCPSSIYRRLIEHSHTSNVHVHIGSPPAVPTYNYWMHCTGDIRNATWRIGDTVLLDRGHMTVLDDPAIRAIAERYADRPGLEGGVYGGSR